MSKVKHIAFIMDGNGRWAEKQGKTRTFGHKQGVSVIKDVTHWCEEANIEAVTFYAFSTENWKRDVKEIEFLMNLPFLAHDKYFKDFKDKNWKLVIIGQKEALPKKLVKLLNQLEEDTSNNNGLIVNLALNYGSQDEILRAANLAAKEGEVTKKSLEKYLYTNLSGDVDLLVRTSGELRLSNFLLWQIAYAELFFTRTLWPDFNKEEFLNILENYNSRDRGFGGTNEK